MGGQCACHSNGAYRVCDYPGGCGSTGGCCSTRAAGTCTLCPVFRPDAEPRLPNTPPVCDGDRNLLDRHLLEIANLVAVLSNEEQPVIDTRRYRRFVVRNGQQVDLGKTFADPLAAVGGVAPINSRSNAPSVSGSKDRPIPIPVAALDLKTRLRPVTETHPFCGAAEDQIGHQPAAVVLAEWVRDIRDTLAPGQHLPKPGVDDLIMWLRNRLNDTCDRHPAVAEFAEEIRSLRSALRSASGETEPKQERCDGIPCRRCDLMTLFRRPDGVECMNPDCAAVYLEDEYADWVKTLAAEHKTRTKIGVSLDRN